MCVYIYIYIHMYTYVCVCIYVYIYIYVCARRRSCGIICSGGSPPRPERKEALAQQRLTGENLVNIR